MPMASIATSVFGKEALVSCLHGDPSSGVCSLLFAWTSPRKLIHLLSSTSSHILPQASLSGGQIQSKISSTLALNYSTWWPCSWPCCLTRAQPSLREGWLSGGSSHSPTDRYVQSRFLIQSAWLGLFPAGAFTLSRFCSSRRFILW